MCIGAVSDSAKPEEHRHIAEKKLAFLQRFSYGE